MKLGILGKVLIPILLVLLVVTGGGFYFSYSKSSEAIETLLRAELRALSRLVGRNIVTFATTAERDLHSMAIRSYVVDLIAQPTPENATAAVPQMANFIERYPHFSSVLLATPQGTVLAASDKRLMTGNVADTPYFRSAVSGKTAFSDVTASPLEKEYIMNIAVPVKGPKGVSAVIVAGIPLKEYSSALVDGITVGRTGYPFIVAPNGITLAHPVSTNVGVLQLSEYDWGRNAMQATDGFINYTWQGVDKMAAVFQVNELGYRVIFPMNTEEVAERIQPAVNASIIALVSVLVLISATLFFMIRTYVSRPLGLLSKTADTVARGDLNVDMLAMAPTFANKGEMTTTFTSLSQMLASLKESITLAEQKTTDAAHQTELARQATAEAEEARKQAERAKAEGMHNAAVELEDSIAVISSASEELSAQIEQSGRGSEEQAHRVTETATAMEEMNATVIEVARSASAAAEMSNNTKSKAEEGARIVHEVVTSIRDVQKQSLELKADMDVLAEHAQSINQIMRVISDIADQTNLLALNAAIEAARAGDAGRGFAVVADEVRKLAEKTMTSTGDVGAAINSIQQATTKNMQQVDTTVKTIDTATSLADKSGSVLMEIVGLADHTADQVRSIATASEEQSATSEEINRAISHVNIIASQTSTAMSEASQAVGDLASQAQALQRLVRDMKTT